MFNIVGFHIPSNVASKHQGTLKNKLGVERLGIGNVGHDERIYTKLQSEDELNKHSKFKAETSTHNEFNKNILETITSSDARTILISEDEISQTNKWTRIFPTPTSYPYLQYLSNPSYADHLLGAWEIKYGTSKEKREEGHQIIKNLCEEKKHLIVPNNKYTGKSFSNFMHFFLF